MDTQKDSLTVNLPHVKLNVRKWFLKQKGKMYVKIKLSEEEFKVAIYDTPPLLNLDGTFVTGEEFNET